MHWTPMFNARGPRSRCMMHGAPVQHAEASFARQPLNLYTVPPFSARPPSPFARVAIASLRVFPCRL